MLGSMSPFREAPQVELGPPEVGLEVAASRATMRLPRGGRLVAAPPALGDARRSGALGSAGLLLVSVIALVAWSTGWQPSSIAELAATVPVVVFGGLSLAVVFSAVDRLGHGRGRRSTQSSTGALVVRGEVVGRKARDVLRRLARIEAHARRRRPDPGRASALRLALTATADPDILPWIPADVRGRAELLLAREIAATGGPSWQARSGARREVRALLTAAAAHLDDGSPARADLAVLGTPPARRVAPRDDLAEETFEEPLRPRFEAGRW
jgi:hypothetical protein